MTTKTTSIITPVATQPSTPRVINVYCDESCHLENDNQKAMVIGSIRCPRQAVQRITKHIRVLKRAHDLDPYLELKWTKVSPAKIAFYKELLAFFFEDEELRFRAVVIPEKSVLRHEDFGQSHDDFYYKIYYYMLQHIINPSCEYHVYIDIKDTRGAKRVAKLQEVLCNKFYDFDRSVIKRVQQVRSQESELLQLADILVGATSFANRGLSLKSGKGQLVDYVNKRPEVGGLDRTSAMRRTKFNLLVWQPYESQK